MEVIIFHAIPLIVWKEFFHCVAS